MKTKCKFRAERKCSLAMFFIVTTIILTTKEIIPIIGDIEPQNYKSVEFQEVVLC